MPSDERAGADGRAGIDAALVRRLIGAQFPEWAGLEVVPVAVDGWDNRTYRLGAEMTVRLPTAAAYVPAVHKECVWLPRLAPHLPTAVPTVLVPQGDGGRLRKPMTASTAPNTNTLTDWRKSSYSSPDSDNCLEVLDTHPAGIPVRDSKNPTGPALLLPAPAWADFIRAVKHTQPGRALG